MTTDTRPPKETGTGETTIDFTCDCGNAWEAPAAWEGNTRIVLLDPASERCGNCGREGRSS